MMKFILLFFSLLLWAAPVQATVLMPEEGFENHLTPNWDTSACSGGAINPGPQDGCNPRISTTIAHSGTHSLLADYTCTTQSSGIGCGTFMDRLFPASGDVWFRYYSYTVSGFQYWPTNMAKRFSLRPTSGFANMWIAHWYGRTQEQFSLEYSPPTPVDPPCPAGNTECATLTANMNGGGPLTDGVWHCLVGHLHANTVGLSDGAYEMWVDGTQTLSYLNRFDFIQTEQWGTFRFYVQNSIGTMYYDDVIVATTRAEVDSCGGGGTITDTTPPAVPTGLAVH